MRQRWFIVMVLILLVLMSGPVVRGVAAHGGAEVAAEPTVVEAGATITVSADGFEPDTLVSVTLEGVSGSTALGTLTTDAEGAGKLVATVPADVAAGEYSIRAVGGDENEMTDLSVTAPSTGGEEGSDNHADEEAGLTYDQPTAQWVGIALAAAIMGLAGFALVLRRD